MKAKARYDHLAKIIAAIEVLIENEVELNLPDLREKRDVLSDQLDGLGEYIFSNDHDVGCPQS